MNPSDFPCLAQLAAEIGSWQLISAALTPDAYLPGGD